MSANDKVAAAMGSYVSQAFFTYEEMREQRDQALIRAEAAEQELAAATQENEKAELAVAGALGCLDAANDFESLPDSVQRARQILRAQILGES